MCRALIGYSYVSCCLSHLHLGMCERVCVCLSVQCSGVCDAFCINWMLHVFLCEFHSVEISGFGSVVKKMKVRWNYSLISSKISQF